MSTKRRLSEALRSAGLRDMAAKALSGYYDDFESPLAFPIIQLVKDLEKAGQGKLVERVIHGEFDGTKEEAKAWFKKEGKDLIS